jgi:hypothetical protein
MTPQLFDKKHLTISIAALISTIITVVSGTRYIATQVNSINNSIDKIQLGISHIVDVLNDHNWRITYLEQKAMK